SAAASKVNSAVGVALPGLPGLMVGRNSEVAFGITNGYGDSQDHYIETLDAQGKHYRQDGGWRPLQERREILLVKDDSAPNGLREQELLVRSTERGPIVSDHPGFKAAPGLHLSLRWVLHTIDSPEIGIDKFLEASSVAELESAVDQVDLMYFNYVLADRQGNIALRTSGLIPKRSNGHGAYPLPAQDNWLGSIPKNEMVAANNPDRGWVASANNDLRPEGYPHYYSAHFSPAYRYKRISERLNVPEKLSGEDNWNIILDTKNLQAIALKNRFAKAMATEPELKPLADELARWNGEDDKDLIGPSIYHVLYENLFEQVFIDELGEPLMRRLQASRYFWLERFDKTLQAGSSPWFDDINTPTQESLDDIIVRAAHEAVAYLKTELGENQNQWQWGRLHVVKFVSPLRQQGAASEWLGLKHLPVSGSGETVQRGQYYAPDCYCSTWFDSLRMVADMADDEKAIGVIAGGVTARQGHKYFKNLVPIWHNNQYIHWWLKPEMAREQSRVHIRLGASVE
ncbi:MAG: penicillin acylase family protein, partial [Cellvibrionaceae bacterium]|nr:penicillin acylase family protein [Cellvibrionaceae bacterium]